jgi:hypothetical protein
VTILPIHWEEFSWEAFATLATGLAAVVAAFIVGRSQVAISRRQTEILERQVGLDALKLRSELFERRMVVYEATKDFLIAIIQHAREPDGSIWRAFILAVDQAKFLFRPATHAELLAIRDLCGRFFVANAAKAANFASTGKYGTPEEIDREHTLFLAINDRLTNLSDTFGDELSLGQG